jgi:hypothetical protein
MKRIAAALAFFAVSETVFLGLGAAYAVLTEHVCEYGGGCANPQPRMVNPPVAGAKPPLGIWPYTYYGPRE